MNEPLGINPSIIVSAAEARGIPWRQLEELKLIQLGHGRHRRWIRSLTTELESEVSVGLVQDKDLTKRILRAAGLPVPRGNVAREASEALVAFAALGPPVVVKPANGQKGRGVSLGLCDGNQVSEAFLIAARTSLPVVVEEQFIGRDYRVLVVGGRVFAVAERTPATVTGDGTSSVRELVEAENRDPMRGQGNASPMTRIPLDAVARAFLLRSGLTPESVPAAGQRIALRQNANLSKGGSAADMTDAIHREARELCERAARVVGLGLCGIDLVLEDISLPLSRQRGGIIEINAGPGIRSHAFPSRGMRRDAGGAILSYLFPEGGDGRIPLLTVGGRPQGEASSAANILRNLLLHQGFRTGLGAIQRGSLLLTDPDLDAAIFLAEGDKVSEGDLEFDRSDLAILTGGDPSSQDLLASRVRPGGTLVLNAESEDLRGIALCGGSGRKILLYSRDSRHPWIQRQVARGEPALFLDGDALVEFDGHSQREILAMSSLEPALRGPGLIAAIAASRTLREQ